jgi:hypothetical protein
MLAFDTTDETIIAEYTKTIETHDPDDDYEYIPNSRHPCIEAIRKSHNNDDRYRTELYDIKNKYCSELRHKMKKYGNSKTQKER